MADWASALQALGQNLMQFPELRMRQQQFQRERDLWKTEDALNAQRLAREKQAMDFAQQKNAREQREFDWSQSDKLADSSRIGSELFLDDPLWQAIAKGPGASSFEGIRANPVVGDPLKDALPQVSADRTVHGFGIDADQSTIGPSGPVTGMRRVPNFTEQQLIQQTRNQNLNDYNLGMLAQGGERLRQGQERLETFRDLGEGRLENQRLALSLAHQRLQQAQAVQDTNAAQRAATDIARISLGMLNVASRNQNATTNRWTGEQNPAMVDQSNNALAALTQALKLIPQPPTASAPPPPPGGGSDLLNPVIPDQTIMRMSPDRVATLAAAYKADLEAGRKPPDPAIEEAFRRRRDDVVAWRAAQKAKP